MGCPKSIHICHINSCINIYPKKYIIANLAKGGVVKAFDKISGKLIINDCGLIGQLENNKAVTTQWIDLKYRFCTHLCDG